MLISRVKQVYLYIFSNFNEEWNSEVKKILSKEEFLIFSKMKKYDKVHSYNLYQPNSKIKGEWVTFEKLKNINFELAELCLQHHNKDVNEKMKIFQELDDK